MFAEEQLQVIDALTPSLTDHSQEVRKEALHCMVGFGLDGLGRIIDVLEDASCDRKPARDDRLACDAMGGGAGVCGNAGLRGHVASA